MTNLNIKKQHTLSKAVEIKGKGLQTNAKVNLRLLPSEPNTGIVFVRVDLEDSPNIKACCDYVDSTIRCTRLAKDKISVSTVEHLLAALVGCRIDNAVLEIDGPEVPILDGSSQPFVEAILKAGVKQQDIEKVWVEFKEPIRVTDEESNAEILLIPHNEYKITSVIDFAEKPIHFQAATLEHIDNFIEKIAPARTFCFYSEIEDLLKQGLIKGGDVDNAIVIIDKKLSDVSHEQLNKEEVYTNGQFMTQVPLRFENELARHKLLDVIGDLSLSGVAFKAHIVCNKPGHKINIQLAKKIKAYVNDQHKTIDIAKYLLKKPILDINQIATMLPHKYPFLLVDKVVESSDTSIVGIKNVTIDEPFFQGHFPNNPVLPGVLIVETMAQLGGLFVLNKQDDPTGFDTYFLKIDDCKFKRKVLPGDTLIIKMDMKHESIQRGITEMQGYVYANGLLCCEALLVAQIVKRKK